MAGEELTLDEILDRPYSWLVVPAGGGFRGEILEFPGVNAVADTADDVIYALMQSARSWLEAVIDRGQVVPEPLGDEHSGRLVLRLPASVHRRAALLARRDGVSLNAWLMSVVASACQSWPGLTGVGDWS